MNCFIGFSYIRSSVKITIRISYSRSIKALMSSMKKGNAVLNSELNVETEATGGRRTTQNWCTVKTANPLSISAAGQIYTAEKLLN